uniref:sigma factor-like helix-turn-helix DNA-binding protein n=1 Tax=Segatella baroniae TaxID=305719 RepID=UPI00374253A7
MRLLLCTVFRIIPIKEIAHILQVSPKTVDYRIQQALKQLHRDLRDYYPFVLLCMGASTL